MITLIIITTFIYTELGSLITGIIPIEHPYVNPPKYFSQYIETRQYILTQLKILLISIVNEITGCQTILLQRDIIICHTFSYFKYLTKYSMTKS